MAQAFEPVERGTIELPTEPVVKKYTEAELKEWEENIRFNGRLAKGMIAVGATFGGILGATIAGPVGSVGFAVLGAGGVSALILPRHAHEKKRYQAARQGRPVPAPLPTPK